MPCCDNIFTDYLSMNDNTLAMMVGFFLTGFIGSFTHCVFMCGSIAIGQMSIRLMQLPNSQLNQRNKFLCALSVPYYFGKTAAYITMGSAAFVFSVAIENSVMQIVGALCMTIAALFFVLSAFHIQIFSTINIRFLSNIMNNLSRYINKMIPLSHPNRWLVGFLLGFIPCGLVYASVTAAVAYSSNIVEVMVVLFCFGIGTMPGLLILTFFGRNILNKWKNIFEILYCAIMLYNAYILFGAAWMHISIL